MIKRNGLAEKVEGTMVRYRTTAREEALGHMTGWGERLDDINIRKTISELPGKA
jgi:hypothetical protein